MGSPLNVNDLIIHRSDRSGVQELSVTIHKFPANCAFVIYTSASRVRFLVPAQDRKRRHMGDGS